MRIRPYENLIYLYLKRLKAGDRRDTGIESLERELVRDILVVSSTAIGDTLLSTPAIRAVRKAYPDARIVALLNETNMELFANNPNIDAVVPYHGGYKRFFETVRRLREFKPDLAIIFHGNEPQATPLCYLAGARFIVKLPNRNRYNFLLSNKTPLLGWPDLGHGLEARLKAARLAGCEPDGVRMDLVVDPGAEAEAAAFLERRGAVGAGLLIGFQPGASTLSRRWFPDRFVELGTRLLDRYPSARLVITGSPAEKELTGEIARGVGGGRVIDSAGELTLNGTAALIGRLACLVTGDTGPMHMAVALATPVVALFAVADPGISGPIYDLHLHRVIKKPRTCEPCVSKKCRYQECMEAITVAEVEEKVEEVISMAGGRV